MYDKRCVPARNMSQKEIPLVSIVTPSYNQGRFIEETILSVKNQDYPNIEHIIVDGGSTDNTLEIIKKYEGTYNMHWISEPDEGQADAINKGFKMAKGEVIGWLNSDDCYFTKGVVAEVIEFFKRNPTTHIVYGDLAIIDEFNQVVSVVGSLPFFSYRILKMLDYLPQPSMFLVQDVVHKEKLRVNFHYVMDYEYWLRLGKKYKFSYLSKILAAFRVHEKSKSVSDKVEMSAERNIVGNQWAGKKGNILAVLLPRLLKIKMLPRIHNLYHQSASCFACNVHLIDERTFIIRQIVPHFMLRKLEMFIKLI